MNDATWDGIERRKQAVPLPGPSAGTSDAAFLQYIVAQLEAINSKMDEIHREHYEIKNNVQEIKDAFPKTEEGEHDFDGHRDDHVIRRDAARSWKEIGQEVKKKVASGATWAVICFIGLAIYQFVKGELNK